MNLMRGPKEEATEEIVEEKEDFGPLKPLGVPSLTGEETGSLAISHKDDNNKSDNLSSTSPSTGEENDENTTEEGQDSPKEEQLTLQDLLG